MKRLKYNGIIGKCKLIVFKIVIFSGKRETESHQIDMNVCRVIIFPAYHAEGRNSTLVSRLFIQYPKHSTINILTITTYV